MRGQKKLIPIYPFIERGFDERFVQLEYEGTLTGEAIC